MINAYGYNRDPKDFAHVEVDHTRIFIDHNGTRGALSGLITGGGTRAGDTIVILSIRDIGEGAAGTKNKELIEAIGVTIQISPIPEAVKEKLPRGRPAFDPERELDDDLRRMWGDPIGYTPKYVVKYATEKYKKSVTRNQLNHRYGNRYSKESSSE